MLTDILLINAITRKQIPAYVPNGLLWIAGVLREGGFGVQIYDRNTDYCSIEEVLETTKPKMVGVSVLTGGVILDAIKVSKAVRLASSNPYIVWGGLHPTLFPECVLSEDYVDYIVMGEGEYPALELAQHLLEGKHKLIDLKNIGYKSEGKVFLNSLRDFIDMDSLPMPAFDLIQLEKYFLLRPYAKRTICLMTSRGCPYNCTFCYNKKVNKGKWRGLSASKLIDMIIMLQNNYSIDGFLFHDDNFDANSHRLYEFCNTLINKNIKIKWEKCSRVNYAEECRLRLEKKAGCEIIAYGIESGSERILKIIKKGQTVSQIENAIKLCKRIGISTSVGSIIGYPFETEEDLKKTLSLFNRLKPTHVFTTIYNPYPGSDLYEYVKIQGLFKEPSTLEEQGNLYNLENLELNMSSISSQTLRKIIYKYSTKNLINEIIDYMRFFNLKGLIKATMNYSLRPGALKRIIATFTDIFKFQKR